MNKQKHVGAVNAKVQDADQPKLPFAFSIAMFLAPLCWYGPAASARGTLLPQLFSQIDPSRKIWAVGILGAVATITGAITNFLFGAMSDVNRSRFGQRKPYIVVGTLIMALSLVIVANLRSVIAIIFVWVLVSGGENIVAAAIYPQISDRVAPRWRGTLSTFYGVGMTAAQQGFAILAAQFLGNVKYGLYTLAAISVVLCLVHVLLADEQSNLDQPKIKFDKEAILKYFTFPTKGARDFYLALTGKFFMIVGYMIVFTYLLYIFTDYIHLSSGRAGESISIYSTISLVVGVFFAAVAGPIADKMKRVKLPIIIATVILAIAPLFPMLVVKPWAMFAYAGLAAVGNGVYNSVDGALNLDVLPSSDTAGKDLGLINLANTFSQMLAAIIASIIVSAFGFGAIFYFAIGMEIVAIVLMGSIKSVR